MCDHYKPVSKYYNLLSSIYSLGQIPRCRNAFFDEIADSLRNTNQKPVTACFVGAGHGDEAIALAEKGVTVTVVDISESMLGVFHQKLSRASNAVKARVRVIHGDIRNVEGEYDWVLANFFLNVFPESEMEEMVNVLLAKCRQDGQIIIGDFYHEGGSRLVSAFQKVNWTLALTMFRIFVKNAKHPIYDYRELLMKRGWKHEEEKKFGWLGVGFYLSARYGKFA